MTVMGMIGEEAVMQVYGGQIRLALVDHDSLRASRDARELRDTLRKRGATAEVLTAAAPPAHSEDKGVPVFDLVGLLLNATSVALAVVQTWLTRSPGRRVRVERADGAVLEIAGKQARQDPALLERFWAADTTASAPVTED